MNHGRHGNTPPPLPDKPQYIQSDSNGHSQAQSRYGTARQETSPTVKDHGIKTGRGVSNTCGQFVSDGSSSRNDGNTIDIENWIPAPLLDKSITQLASLAATSSTNPDDAELLSALAQTHPSLSLDASRLLPMINYTIEIADRLSQRHAHLLLLRERAQDRLLRLHALERQWREKQAQLEQELEPWSAKALYQKLREAERHGEETCTAMESSWLEDAHGEVSERELTEWLRNWRERRVKSYKRREFRHRWDEGRVGGWR